MVEETCKACGYVSHLGAVARHHVVPKNVTMEAGMPDSATVSLCNNCRTELDRWYRMKVADTVYDHVTKRFIDKSWEDKVKDYESAFKGFIAYKGQVAGRFWPHTTMHSGTR